MLDFKWTLLKLYMSKKIKRIWFNDIIYVLN